MSDTFEQQLEILDAEQRVLIARRKALLLQATSAQKGCADSSCPGPKLHRIGGCPQGYSGSCRRAG